jgi:uncharacterized protein YjbJ (UPF0337 family)
MAMTRFRQKIEAQTMQIVGQMIGDDQLVREGQEEQRQAEIEAEQEQQDGHRDRPASTSHR